MIYLFFFFFSEKSLFQDFRGSEMDALNDDLRYLKKIYFCCTWTLTIFIYFDMCAQCSSSLSQLHISHKVIMQFSIVIIPSISERMVGLEASGEDFSNDSDDFEPYEQMFVQRSMDLAPGREFWNWASKKSTELVLLIFPRLRHIFVCSHESFGIESHY